MPLPADFAAEVTRLTGVVWGIDPGTSERADAVNAVFRYMGDNHHVWVDHPHIRRSLQNKARELGRDRVDVDRWLALCGEPAVAVVRACVVTGHIVATQRHRF
jgi:hypothetical protein